MVNEKKLRLGENVPFYIIFFAVMTFLAFLFPHTLVDDLAWGTDYGLGILANKFDGYNGRYLGNLMVIGLMRAQIILPFVKGVTVTGILYLIQKFSQSSSKAFLYLSAAILAIPGPLFIQGYTWTSGFVNYFFAAFLIMVNFYLLFYKTDLKKLKNFLRIAFLFVFGAAAQLFMEVYSILCVGVAVAAIIYFLRKNKKLDLASVVYLIACIAGCVIMFSNSAYGPILKNEDSRNYRTVALGNESVLADVMTWVKTLLGEVSFNFARSCVPIIIVFTVLCIIIQKKKNIVPHKTVIFLKILSVISLLASAAVAVYVFAQKLEIKEAKPSIGFMLLPWAVFSLIFIFKISEKGRRNKLIMYFTLIILQIAPFIVVTPVGPRCFAGVYIVFILVIKELLDEIDINEKAFLRIAFVSVCLVLCFNVFAYSHLRMSHNEKIDIIQSEVEKGNHKVYLDHTMFRYLIYCTDYECKAKFITDYFCAYYGFPEEIELIYK